MKGRERLSAVFTLVVIFSLVQLTKAKFCKYITNTAYQFSVLQHYFQNEQKNKNQWNCLN